jgi:signal transduction histidine kinase
MLPAPLFPQVSAELLPGFRRFCGLLAGVAAGFAVLELAVGFALSVPALYVSAAALVALVSTALTVRRFVVPARLQQGALVVQLALLGLIVITAAVLPRTYPTLVLASLLGIFALLPYMQGRALVWLGATTALVAVAVAAWGVLAGPASQPLPRAVLLLTNVGGPGAGVALVLYLVWGFSARQRSFVQAAEDAWQQAAESERRAQFLAHASAVLSESLEYEPMFRKVVKLAVPELADWCTVVALMPDGSLKRVAVEHRDPARAELARRYLEDFPPSQHPEGQMMQVVTEARTFLDPVMDEARLRQSAQSEAHLEVLLGLGVTSCALVPMIAHGKVYGVFSFMISTGTRRYGPRDLPLAEELARRLAMAIENSLLFQRERDAVKLRDEFLSVAGHELRTPLTALKLQFQALLRRMEAGQPVPRERTRRLHQQLQRLGALVEDLLDVSKLSHGRFTIHSEQVDLPALVREVAARFEEAAARAGCRLSVSAPEALVGWWDRMRLEQVVQNLLSNALKYGNGAPVEVRLEQREDRAVLTVKDGGIGIDPVDQARIFERFERAVSGDHYGGLGLGLWITRQVVEASGGTIRVRSTPGAGALFEVTLPCGLSEQAEVG